LSVLFFLSVYPLTCWAFGLLLVPIMHRLCSAVRTEIINPLTPGTGHLNFSTPFV
jgi:hypothetical protein